jgi:hypothetical protein
VLYRRAGENDCVWPAFKTIAYDLGKCERQARYDIIKLKHLGLIKPNRVGGRHSNTYSFLWHEMFERQSSVTHNHPNIPAAPQDRLPDRQPIATQTSGDSPRVAITDRQRIADLSGNALPPNSLKNDFIEEKREQVGVLEDKAPSPKTPTNRPSHPPTAVSLSDTQKTEPPSTFILVFRDDCLRVLKGRGLAVAPKISWWRSLYQAIISRNGHPCHFLERLKSRKRQVTSWGLLQKLVDDIENGREDWERMHPHNTGESTLQEGQNMGPIRLGPGDEHHLHIPNGIKGIELADESKRNLRENNLIVDLVRVDGDSTVVMRFRQCEPGEVPGEMLVRRVGSAELLT